PSLGDGYSAGKVYRDVMTTFVRLLLIFATLHAQTPCCLVYHSLHETTSEYTTTASSAVGGEGRCQTAVKKRCPCCPAEPDSSDSTPTPSKNHPPGCPDGCPPDCPCMFCSPGFVPLTDFGSLTLSAHVAVGPHVVTAVPSRGHAGHYLLLDRPP